MKLSLYEQETIILYNQLKLPPKSIPMTPGYWKSCGGWRRNTRTRL